MRLKYFIPLIVSSAITLFAQSASTINGITQQTFTATLSGSTVQPTVNVKASATLSSTVTAANTTYILEGGTHQNDSITPADGMTLLCAPNSTCIVDGGTVLTMTGPDGNSNFHVVNATAETPDGGSCTSGTACTLPNDLFYDGTPQQRIVGNPNTLTTGQWSWDHAGSFGTANTVYLHVAAVSGHIVILDTKVAGMVGNVNNVTIIGVTFQHYASPYQTPCVGQTYDGLSPAQYGRNWFIDKSSVIYCHGRAVNVNTDSTVTNTTITGGEVGFGGIGDHITIGPGNLMTNNGYLANNGGSGYTCANEGGGGKWGYSTFLKIIGNEATNNHCVDIWLDTDNVDFVVSGNYLHDSQGGIQDEINRNGKMYNNLLLNEGNDSTKWGVIANATGNVGGCSISVLNSNGADVFGNQVVIGATQGIGICLADSNARGNDFNGVPYATFNNRVHGNYTAMHLNCTLTSCSLGGISSDETGTRLTHVTDPQSNQFDNNYYCVSNGGGGGTTSPMQLNGYVSSAAWQSAGFDIHGSFTVSAGCPTTLAAVPGLGSSGSSTNNVYNTLNLTSALHLIGNSGTPAIAAGGAIGTTPTVVGNDLSGVISIPSSAVTIGTIATVTFFTPYIYAPSCVVTQNGGTVAVDVGHGTPSTTAFTVTSSIANISATTYKFDYICTGN